MATQPTFYNDGSWTAGFQVGADKPTWPFLNDVSPPNTYSKITELSYRILPASYAPLIGARTTYTNLLLQSSAFTTTWTSTNVTPTAAGRANPDTGEVTMFKVLETTANAEHYVTQTASTTAAAYTFSFFAAGGLGRDYVYAKLNDGASNFTCFFNIATGTVGTASGCTGAIVPLPDGSYRCSITATCAAGSGAVFIQAASGAATISYTGDAAKGFYVWGAQLELASSVGPYISTTTVSRSISSPSWLPATDTFAYLAYESDISIDQIQRASFMRRYARIPPTTYLYEGSQYLAFPTTPSGGTVFDIQVNTPFSVLDAAIIGTAGYFTNSVYFTPAFADEIYNPASYGGSGFFVRKTISAVTVGYATAGTFTLTYKSSTTAGMAYNASTATIQSTLNALASVIADGITFTCTGGTGTPLTDTNGGNFTLTRSVATAAVSPVTMNSSGLTCTTNNTSYRGVLETSTESYLLTDTFTSASHGFSASNRLLYGATAFLIYRIAAPGSWAVIDANTIGVPTSGQSLVYEFAGSNSSGYSGGTALVRTRVKRNFYLPGVTIGITTVSDIQPEIGLQQNSMALLNAIGAGGGFQTYQSNGPKPWPEAPQIYIVDALQIVPDDFVNV